VTRRFKLSAVLRARQAQEDAARAAVVRARGTIRAAQHEAGHRERELRAHGVPEGEVAKAVVAALLARRAMAADVALAQATVGRAEEAREECAAALTEAARRRRVVESLAERHAAARRARDLAADQAALDELAVTAAQRAAARGGEPR